MVKGNSSRFPHIVDMKDVINGEAVYMICLGCPILQMYAETWASENTTDVVSRPEDATAIVVLGCSNDKENIAYALDKLALIMHSHPGKDYYITGCIDEKLPKINEILPKDINIISSDFLNEPVFNEAVHQEDERFITHEGPIAYGPEVNYGFGYSDMFDQFNKSTWMRISDGLDEEMCCLSSFMTMDRISSRDKYIVESFITSSDATLVTNGFNNEDIKFWSGVAQTHKTKTNFYILSMKNVLENKDSLNILAHNNLINFIAVDMIHPSYEIFEKENLGIDYRAFNKIKLVLSGLRRLGVKVYVTMNLGLYPNKQKIKPTYISKGITTLNKVADGIIPFTEFSEGTKAFDLGKALSVSQMLYNNKLENILTYKIITD